MAQTDKVAALHLYVADRVRWNEFSFARNVVNLLCTFDYREKYRFNTTGGLIYEKAVYVAPRFRLFLIEVARHVAHKAEAHFDQKKIERQYKIQFQPGTVKREKKRMMLPKSQRTKEGFTTTEDEEDEEEEDEPKPKEKRKTRSLRQRQPEDDSSSEDEEPAKRPPKAKRQRTVSSSSDEQARAYRQPRRSKRIRDQQKESDQEDIRADDGEDSDRLVIDLSDA